MAVTRFISSALCQKIRIQTVLPEIMNAMSCDCEVHMHYKWLIFLSLHCLDVLCEYSVKVKSYPERAAPCLTCASNGQADPGWPSGLHLSPTWALTQSWEGIGGPAHVLWAATLPGTTCLSSCQVLPERWHTRSCPMTQAARPEAPGFPAGLGHFARLFFMMSFSAASCSRGSFLNCPSS